METRNWRVGGAKGWRAKRWGIGVALGVLMGLGSGMTGLGRAQTPAAQEPATTVKEVAAKNVAAMGGEQNFQAIHSMRVTGKLRFQDGRVWGVKVQHLEPNRFRIDLDVSGQAITQAFDGTTGWQVSPGSEPQALQGDELKSVRDQAENAVGNPLVDYEARGNMLEMLPEATVDGKACHVVKVTLKSGNTMTMYFDRKTFLEVKEVLPRMNAGKDATIVEAVSDYKKFGAVYLPSLYVSGPVEDPQQTALVIEGVEFNPPMDAEIFRMPGAAPAAAAPTAPAPAPTRPAAPGSATPAAAGPPKR